VDWPIVGRREASVDGEVLGDTVRLKRYGLCSDDVIPLQSACLRSTQLTSYHCSMIQVCRSSSLGDIDAEDAGLTGISRQGRKS